MINKNIIKIASNTKFEGLKKNFTHKASAKNSICGDSIKIETIMNKRKIISMRYETNSCILCEASASYLANRIKKISLKDLKKLKEIKKTKKITIPSKIKDFSLLLNKKNWSRLNCVILPIDALIKTFKVNR